MSVFEPFRLDLLPMPESTFRHLSDSSYFSTSQNGRQGGIIVRCTEDGSVPIVRTTTAYPRSPRSFSPLHETLIGVIRDTLSRPALDFNNGMVELYSHLYRKMGFHSDQTLDLVPGSTIALFSCYSDPTTTGTRTLVVQDKQTGQEKRYDMAHNSLITFDTHTNGRHVHKIILEEANKKDVAWLGLTLRMSKTFARHEKTTGDVYISQSSSVPLRLASVEETKQFMQLKSLENKQSGWQSVEAIGYTLSPGDLMPMDCF